MDRMFERLLSGLNMLASIWILSLIALISADVIGRGAFNYPLFGVPEIVKFSIVAMVWLQMAYVLRKGGHLRSTLGYDFLPGWARIAVTGANAIAGFGIFALVAWLGAFETLKSWQVGAFEGARPVRIPIWPIWGIVSGGAALTALQCLVELARLVRHGHDAAQPRNAPDTAQDG